MAKVELTDDEEALAHGVRDRVKKIRELSAGKPAMTQAFDELADIAHRLHLSLRARGLEPLHHKYMVENRGVAPIDPQFYRHLHSADDLLKFI